MKEYTINSIKSTGDTDKFGNQVGFAEFEGVKDGVMVVAKELPAPDTKVFGDLVEKTGKSGKKYYRFYRKSREDNGYTNDSSSKPVKKSYEKSPAEQENIRRSVALNNAVTYAAANVEAINNHMGVLDIADDFVVWLAGTGDTTEIFNEEEPEQNQPDLSVFPEENTRQPVNVADIPF